MRIRNRAESLESLVPCGDFQYLGKGISGIVTDFFTLLLDFLPRGKQFRVRIPVGGGYPVIIQIICQIVVAALPVVVFSDIAAPAVGREGVCHLILVNDIGTVGLRAHRKHKALHCSHRSAHGDAVHGTHLLRHLIRVGIDFLVVA